MKPNIRRPLQVLMIDDNSADVELVREIFQERGQGRVFNEVRDGNEALQYLRRAGRYYNAPRPDLVLLDLNMPGISGYDVLREIRQDTALSCIPVIILSSSTAQDDVDRGYEFSANAYLSKPVGLDQFSELVRNLETFWLDIVRLPSRSCGK